MKGAIAPPKIGISACLLGEKVRYDGLAKQDHFLTDTVGRFVQWVPVCPEVECGLPIPRESMHLEGDSANPRLITTRTRVDHTDRMLKWARRRLKELEKEDLAGYVFKANSPSSGMERVRVYDDKGIPHRTGVGIWARAFMEHFPLLPVEEEGRLLDPSLRENFFERVFCLKRYRNESARRRGRGALVAFHGRHKLQIMAHSPKILKEMGNLVAHAKDADAGELFAQYEDLLMSAMRLKATPAKNANVLQHALGYFKKVLSADEKQELLAVIERYRSAYLPLVVPVTLISHYARKYGQPYLAEQSYLDPHPVELKLRNHA